MWGGWKVVDGLGGVVGVDWQAAAFNSPTPPTQPPMTRTLATGSPTSARREPGNADNVSVALFSVVSTALHG